MKILTAAVVTLLALANCQSQTQDTTLPAQAVQTPQTEQPVENGPLMTGAEQMDKWVSKTEGRNIGLVVNHTSLVGSTHLVDTLKSWGATIKTIFGPEHGYKGTADAGEAVSSSDNIISLYGSKKKPTPEDLTGIDLMIFDIQDVGVRCYTYISTMHYVMEACAENGIPLLILDRPNPNGFFVDGPTLKMEFSSFVGMHPVPLVHGMTVGEYANMINGERWLAGGVQCQLEVIPCVGYDHDMLYQLPVKPSPNLPTMHAVYLYPTLVLFEGTKVSVGRGTDKPFQIMGDPKYPDKTFTFTPQPTEGAKNPKYNGIPCYGKSMAPMSEDYLRTTRTLWLDLLVNYHYKTKDIEPFFNPFFTKLAGNERFQKLIEAGNTATEIQLEWAPQLAAFKEMRAKYLLYPDYVETKSR